MMPSLRDLTDTRQNSGFATYLNALPEDRKQSIRKALEEAPAKTVDLHPALREQVEAIRKDATNNSGATVAFGAVPYSLEAPALNLWPVVTKFRNAIPRRTIGGTGHHWKQITKIDTAPTYGFVAEPTDTTSSTTAGRAGFMKWNEKDQSIAFATMGIDDYITFAAKYGSNTAINSGMNFRTDEVVRLATLQACMMREERAIIGANLTALASTGMTPTLTGVTQLAAASGSLSVNTGYKIQISALTALGVESAAQGHASVDAAGETNAAAATTLTTAASGVGSTSLAFTWPWKSNAVAYNVFADTATPKYMTTVYSNYYVLTTLTPTGYNTNVPNSADQTADTNGWNGLIPLFVANGGYVATLGGATAQTWTSSPTSSGAMNVDQFDAAFLSLFVNYQTGPTRIFINAVDKKKITAAIAGATIASGTAPYLSFAVQGGDGNYKGGVSFNGVLNQYTGQNVDLVVHPYIPQGTAILWCDDLGEYYPNAKIPTPVEMLLAYDYMNVEWARTALREEFGVYFCGAPTLHAGFPMGIIQGAV
jgi:hypothetical protein